MRRFVLLFSLLFGLACLTLAILAFHQSRRLTALDRQIEATMDRAVEAARQLRDEAPTRTSEIRLQLNPRLLRGLLKELRGFEHLSKRHNLLRVEDLTLAFREGYIDAQLLADFTWHRGFYQGPVRAHYAVFSQVDNAGMCQLDFHIKDVEPLG